MTEQSTKDKPKTRSMSYQPLPVFAMRKLAGFADKACSVEQTQTQTRDGFSFDVLGKSVLQTAYSANVPVQKYRDGQLGHPERYASTERSLRSNVSGSTPNNRTALGSEIGTRYRYIDDTPLVPLSEAGNSTNSSASSGCAKT